MKIKKYIIGFLVGAFGMLNVNAAKLEFDGDRSISYNGTGTVDIKLNSEGDEVKNIEFVLNYDTNFINVSINKEQYNLVRKEDGKKVTITSTDPSVSIKDGVIATVTVKNVRPEQANTSLSIKEIKFDLYKLLNGVIKSIIIASVFVGTSYIFDQMKELSEALGVTPKFIIISAITLYVGKALVALGKILGVSVEVKKEGK